jgi:hypothetical protein
MQYSGEIENINPRNALGIRPYCSCCGGGEHRKGYSHTKAKSHSDNQWEYEREQKRKSAVNSKRNRRNARPEKFND